MCEPAPLWQGTRAADMSAEGYQYRALYDYKKEREEDIDLHLGRGRRRGPGPGQSRVT